MISIDSSGNAPGWLVSSVNVRAVGSTAIQDLGFHQWIDADSSVTKSLQ
jgi:hypothetical protein